MGTMTAADMATSMKKLLDFVGGRDVHRVGS